MRTTALLLVIALAAAACGAAAPEADPEQGEIVVEMREYVVPLSSAEVRAGTVTFLVRNRGSLAHNFVVLRTDLASGDLPVDQQSQTAEEEGRVGELEEIAPGRSGQLRLELEPGDYVLICNVPTHYDLGMHIELTVR